MPVRRTPRTGRGARRDGPAVPRRLRRGADGGTARTLRRQATAPGVRHRRTRRHCEGGGRGTRPYASACAGPGCESPEWYAPTHKPPFQWHAPPRRRTLRWRAPTGKLRWCAPTHGAALRWHAPTHGPGLRWLAPIQGAAASVVRVCPRSSAPVVRARTKPRDPMPRSYALRRDAPGAQRRSAEQLVAPARNPAEPPEGPVQGGPPDARCSFRRGCRILEMWSLSGTSRSSGRGGRRG